MCEHAQSGKTRLKRFSLQYEEYPKDVSFHLLWPHLYDPFWFSHVDLFGDILEYKLVDNILPSVGAFFGYTMVAIFKILF